MMRSNHGDSDITLFEEPPPPPQIAMGNQFPNLHFIRFIESNY